MVYTRKQYIQDANNPDRFDKYYGQFVNGAVLGIIKSHFSNPDITAYTLDKWDRFMHYTKECIDRKLWREANEWDDPRSYPWSLNDNICILKTAHKIYHQKG